MTLVGKKVIPQVINLLMMTTLMNIDPEEKMMILTEEDVVGVKEGVGEVAKVVVSGEGMIMTEMKIMGLKTEGAIKKVCIVQ